MFNTARYAFVNLLISQCIDLFTRYFFKLYILVIKYPLCVNVMCYLIPGYCPLKYPISGQPVK